MDSAAPPKTQVTTAPVAPFLYDDLVDIADWQQRLCWPVDPAALRQIGIRAIEVLLGHIDDLDDDLDRQIAVVAVPRLVGGFMVLAEAAYAAQAEAADGLRLVGGPPELDALRGAAGPAAVTEDKRRGLGVFDIRPVRHRYLRGLARAASWSRWWRLPGMVVAPPAAAISHNGLLRDVARRDGACLGMLHAANIVYRARQQAGDRLGPTRGTELARAMIARLSPIVADLDAEIMDRMSRVLLARLEPVFNRIDLDVQALRGFRRLPKAVWSGTNGAYTTRLISAEVVRRGGQATGFDHGGVTGIAQVPATTAMTELRTVTRFCVGTQPWADVVNHSGAQEYLAVDQRPAIIHGAGDPIFRAACRNRAAKPTGRPRVVYVGHPYRGLRQFPIAAVSDAIYWDFQSRLAVQLVGLPIDLICKPHPEGNFVGQRNPIETIAPTSYRLFEEHLDDTDLFVFDAPTSTTFYEALCTDRPMVLIDRGHYPLNPAVQPHVEARCRVVPVRTDDRNRMWVDDNRLADAILTPPKAIDPSYFRRLLAGREDGT